METVSPVTIVNELSVETIQSAVDTNGKTHHVVVLPKATCGIKERTLTQPEKMVKKIIISGMMFVTCAWTATVHFAHHTTTIRIETAFFLL
jgi:hypothetical protein